MFERKEGLQSKVRRLDVTAIQPNPWQPRQTFQQAELEELAQSIAENGILQPLTVRHIDGKWQLIAGERRLRAAKMAGLKQVPCVELMVDDEKAAVLALLENLQRQDLNFFEEAEAIAQLMEEWEITQECAAARLGKSQSALANKIRLLRLSPMERKRILDAGLTERHARALLRLRDPGKREQVLTKIIQKHLNVADTERLIAKLLEPPKQVQSMTPIVKDVRLFFNTVSHAVDTMRKSGIDAEAEKQETEQYIEYIVRIPKDRAAVRSFGKVV